MFSAGSSPEVVALHLRLRLSKRSTADWGLVMVGFAHRLGGRAGRTVIAVTVIGLGALALSLGVSAAASTSVPSNVPYTLGGPLPAATSSPSVDAGAPYTPAVLSLIAQLEPSNPPTRGRAGERDAAAARRAERPPATTSARSARRPGTTPSIAPICWTDAQGVLNTSGPNARGSTGPMTLMGLGSTFDRALGNAWGQTEGTESRAFMVTGLFGPQTDLDRLPNWGRNLTTTGEDPYLSHQLVAAQINGMQGAGAMSEMKHFAVYNGQNQNAQHRHPGPGAARELPDAVRGRVRRRPGRGDDVLVPDLARHLDAPAGRRSRRSARQPSPFARPGQNPQTWPLNESHFSCEQPLSLNYVLRDLWGSQAFVGSDYPATHSTSGILQGEDQEMPTQNGFFSANRR